MADVAESIERVAQTFRDRLSTEAVYGEPVTANGITVIPVAKVAFGFGGGGGTGTGMDPGLDGEMETGSGSGGGGGGGGMVRPVGFLEISDAGARWVPLDPPMGELVLRGLLVLAVVAPDGGRGGFFRRIALLLGGLAAISALIRPKAPAMSFSRRQPSEATPFPLPTRPSRVSL